MNIVFEQTIRTALSEKNYIILKHSVIIQSVTDHDDQIVHDMEDFSVDKNEQMLDIMNDLHKVFYSRSIDLIFELKIQCDAYNE